MNARTLAGILIVVALVMFGIRSWERRRERAERLVAGTTPEAVDPRHAEGISPFESAEAVANDVIVMASDVPAPERDPARIAMLLGFAGDTYLGELLAQHDSLNYRWPDRSSSPMRVWVQEGIAGLDPVFPSLVRQAFSTWSDAGVPIHFQFVLDSAQGEIHVTWVEKFDGQITGRTRWAHDRNQWIVGGSIQLALKQPDDRVLDAESVRAIALHEVGHLIGLDHTADTRNVMAARVRVSELSEADRATARLIYRLPPGSLKAPGGS